MIKEMLNDYTKGLLISDISNKYNVTIGTIHYYRKKHELPIRYRGNYNKYSIDKNYFDKIDTGNKAYILGLLYADGHNDVTSGKIILSLQEDDVEVLEFIKDELSSNQPLYYIKPTLIAETGNLRKPQYRLAINNKYISTVLLGYGMISNKSLNLLFPNIDDNLKSHFIRGYFDGDGTICFDKKENPIFGLRGTLEFIKTVEDILLSSGVIKTPFSIYKEKHDKNNVFASKSGCYNCLSIMKYLYNNSDVYLSRKFDKFNQIKPKRKCKI